MAKAYPEFWSDERVLGVAVSYQPERITPNSDIDLFVVYQGEPEVGISDGRIDVQWIDQSKLTQSLERRFTDLRTLRQAGRLANSSVVWERRDAISRVKRMAGNVALSPAEAAVLLVKSTACLRAAAGDSTLAGSVQMGRGAAYALTTLAISTTRNGYEKPKWQLDTLRRNEFSFLANILCDLVGASGFIGPAETAIQSSRASILKLCELMGWPPLTRSENKDDDYVNIYCTYRDAASLLEAGLVADAMVTADVALRLCEVVASAEVKSQDQKNGLEAWSHAKDQMIADQFSSGAAALQETLNSLREAGVEILRRYKQHVTRVKAGAK